MSSNATSSIPALVAPLNSPARLHARSVKLVAELNALGPRPLIKTRIGGEAAGAAVLTDEALGMLDEHARLEKHCSMRRKRISSP